MLAINFFRGKEISPVPVVFLMVSKTDMLAIFQGKKISPVPVVFLMVWKSDMLATFHGEGNINCSCNIPHGLEI